MTQRNPAAIPTPRDDANSRLAHEQLIAKARAGGIDLYFLGDSITRRWGCTDPQWKDLLEHWNRTFHGWNAGNFGWGADRIEHMLWRIENGELDGVHPKVIVILAGTNNIGTVPGDASKIDDIIAGFDALLAACRRRVPRAKFVITAIFPRNDSSAVLHEIAEVNRRLASCADGERVFFVDVNDRLADRAGRLHDGMAIDGLHLSVKGYGVWADGLTPLLTRLLGPRAAIDRAPPPTGDPSATWPSAAT